MCLQDIQLARACLVNVYNWSIAGVGLIGSLDANQSRVGLFIAGPSTSSVDCRVNTGGGERNILSIGPSDDIDTRFITITEHGLIVTYGLNFYAAAGAQLSVIEYILPMDRQQLQRLANDGKF